MKRKNKTLHRAAVIEVLESRVVLDGTLTSVVVGEMLFTVVASGTTTGK
jgi:hypothetical protein